MEPELSSEDYLHRLFKYPRGGDEGDTIHHPTIHILGWDLLPPVSFKQKMPSEDIFRAPVISEKELSLRESGLISHSSSFESQNLLCLYYHNVFKKVVSAHHGEDAHSRKGYQTLLTESRGTADPTHLESGSATSHLPSGPFSREPKPLPAWP